jgi:heme/copper-type cytochrome/quinol oxidase subunit 1
MNAISLWLTTVGAALVMASLFIGDFSTAGWVGLIPLTEVCLQPLQPASITGCGRSRSPASARH